MRVPRVRFTVRGMMIVVAVVAFLCATGWPPPSPAPWFLPSLMGAYLLFWALLDGIKAVRDTGRGRKVVRPLVTLVIVALAVGVAQERRSYLREIGTRYAGFARGCEAMATVGEQKGEIKVYRRCLVDHVTDPGRVRSEVRHYQELAAHYVALRWKYERAVDRFWLPVAPDPPLPEPP